MKITSWGCCVLVYDSPRETLVHPIEPNFPWTDASGSEVGVVAPTSEEELENNIKKKRKKKKLKRKTERAVKTPLTVVLENWLLSTLHWRFSSRSVAIFPSFWRWCWICSGDFRKRRWFDWRGDWWAVDGAWHNCYKERGTIAWGPSMTDLRLSTVSVRDGVVGAGIWWW